MKTLQSILSQNLSIEETESLIVNSIGTIKLEHELKGKKCCVCGDVAINKKMSIMGQIPFFLCENHNGLSPAMGATGIGTRMGLLDENREWVDIEIDLTKY